MTVRSPSQDCEAWVGLLRRTLSSVLRRAAACVREAGLSAEDVHRARRCFKEAAALLRLVEETDRERTRKAIGRLRDFRRLLGAARDLDVAAQTLDGFAEQLGAGGDEAVRRELAVAKSAAGGVRLSRADLQEIRAGLRELSFEVAHWDLRDADAELLVHALRRAYRKARRAGACAVQTGERVALHDFRKATIVFREQLVLFRPAWPKLIDAWCAEAQSLRNLLGSLNDLALLRDFAERVGEPSSARLLEAIDEKRASSIAFVDPARRRLFGEPPGRMAARVRSWVECPKKSPETAGGDAAEPAGDAPALRLRA